MSWKYSYKSHVLEIFLHIICPGNILKSHVLEIFSILMSWKYSYKSHVLKIFLQISCPGNILTHLMSWKYSQISCPGNILTNCMYPKYSYKSHVPKIFLQISCPGNIPKSHFLETFLQIACTQNSLTNSMHPKYSYKSHVPKIFIQISCLLVDKRYSLMKLKYLDVHLPHAYTALWHFKSAEKQMFWLPLWRPTQSAQSLGCIVQGLEKIPATFCWSYIFYRQKSLVPTQ